jgi:hypothetical protein
MRGEEKKENEEKINSSHSKLDAKTLPSVFFSISQISCSDFP